MQDTPPPKEHRDRHARPRALATLLLVVALAAIAPSAWAARGGKPRSTTGSTTFVKIATHPQAAAQPTAMGRTIATLKGWNGELYSGFGDYGANTGPIAITPFSGAAFAGSPALAADSEAVWIYRALGGRLYAPSIDPRVGAEFAVGMSEGASPSWLNVSPFSASHAFDIVTLTGSDLWLVGSLGRDAAAWRSVDGGSTWTEMLRVPPVNATTDYARFYGAGVLGGKFYVQAMDASAGLHPRSAVFDGTSWSDGPSLTYVFNHAEELGGQLLAHGSYHSAHYAGPLVSFDGTRSSSLQSSIYDYAVTGNTVYVLGTDRSVKSSQDLRNWTQLGTAPSVARSIGVVNGAVYVGGTDSAIYQMR